EVRLPQHRVELGAVEELVDIRHRCGRTAHPGNAHVHALAMAGHLLADPADTNDRERLSGELLTAVALPPLRLLISVHPHIVLREHEHRHETEVRERARVDAARCRKRDLRLIETDALHHLADACARRLQPAEPRRDGLKITEVAGGKVEADLSTS